MGTVNSLALTAEVKAHLGSPALFINGEPTAPLMFYGWAGGSRPYTFELDTAWRTYGFTFTAPEDNDAHLGVHIRLGGSGPGTVWIDDVRVCEGDRDDRDRPNLLQFGGWEGSREEVSRVWQLFTNQEAYGSDADWELVQDDVTEGKQACRVTIRNGGKSTMHCHFYQSGMSCREGQQFTYTVKMRADRKMTGDLQALHHGAPWTLYPPDGEEETPYQSQVRLAAGAGVHIHSFGVGMPWPKEGVEYDFSHVARAFKRTLRADADGLLLPRFGMGAPQWWQAMHPEECLTFDDGKTRGECPASELWRRESLKHLRAFIRFCEENYGDRILGYHPCGQHTGEWFYQRCWEPRLSGFSPAMVTGFRRWLTARYGTDRALRQAWQDPKVTLAAAPVPTAEERRTASHGLFRDPVRERKVIDFYEYKQLAMEEPLEAMAHLLKEETAGRKIVTLFYGYYFDMCGIPCGPQVSGHLAMERMLTCPDVDILCSPISYFDRQSGGAGLFMTAVDSVRAAGKLWLNEDDTRTYLTPKDSGFGRVETPQQTFWVHQRNYGNILPRRMACWYMDLGGIGWLNGQDIWAKIAPLARHYAKSLSEPAEFAPEVAVIVDERSPFSIACSRALMHPQSYLLRARLYRMGTPIRVHYLGDLLAGRVPECRVYIFPTVFRPDSKARESIARATRGRTAVFFYGNGFLGDDRADDALLGSFIGMPVQRTRGKDAQGHWIAGPDPLVSGLPDEPFGSTAALEPLWTVPTGPGIRPLARLSTGETLVAARNSDGGLRVYIGTTDVPAAFLRNVLAESGVHLYIDTDDVVNADSRFLAISATTAGVKHVRLPKAATARDLVTRELVGTAVREFDLTMESGETRLFGLE